MNAIRLAGLALALAVTASAGQAKPKPKEIVPAQIVEYYKKFNTGDPSYADLLADDVEFPHITAGLLKGKAEVVGFYKKLKHNGLQEERVPQTIVIDNKGGLAAVELLVKMWTDPGVEHQLPTGETIKPGEIWEGTNVLFYKIRDGKIVQIRGSRSGPGKMQKVK